MGPSGPGPYGPLGRLWGGPLCAPWALMGWTLIGPVGPYGLDPYGLPGPLLAGPLWASWALVGPGPYGPGPYGPPGRLYMYIYMCIEDGASIL